MIYELKDSDFCRYVYKKMQENELDYKGWAYLACEVDFYEDSLEAHINCEEFEGYKEIIDITGVFEKNKKYCADMFINEIFEDWLSYAAEDKDKLTELFWKDYENNCFWAENVFGDDLDYDEENDKIIAESALTYSLDYSDFCRYIYDKYGGYNEELIDFCAIYAGFCLKEDRLIAFSSFDDT
ncbi:MAG: hypothetical protein NC489_16300 [Ruminococcus flavefaciens]|nr:hypothetical protein [Ruminococcus flavefaciens]